VKLDDAVASQPKIKEHAISSSLNYRAIRVEVWCLLEKQKKEWIKY